MTILQIILLCAYCIIATVFFIFQLFFEKYSSLKMFLISIFWIFLIFEVPYLWIKNKFSTK